MWAFIRHGATRVKYLVTWTQMQDYDSGDDGTLPIFWAHWLIASNALCYRLRKNEWSSECKVHSTPGAEGTGLNTCYLPFFHSVL